MISIRRSIRDRELADAEQLFEKTLECYVRTIGNIEKHAVAVSPEELGEYRERLGTLRKLIWEERSLEVLGGCSEKLEKEIEDYNGKLSAYCRDTQAAAHSIVGLLREAREALASSDAKYQSQFRNVATRIEKTAKCENLDQVRHQLLDHVSQLRTCIEAMRADGSAALRPGEAEMKAIEIRLVEAERLASTDPLTNLANRREGEKRIERQLALGKQVCLLVLDLDHFKAINDRYGHHCGDQVLKIFAKTLQDQIRPVDIACRWGGDEFLVIMDCELPIALTRSGQIATHLHRQYPVVVNGRRMEIGLSASLGVAQCLPGESIETAFERADTILYRVKKQA